MRIGTRIAAWFGGKKLPYKRRLLYVEADGSQYCKTGVGISTETKFEADFQYTKIGNYYCLIGVENSGADRLFFRTTDGYFTVYGLRGIGYISTGLADLYRHEVIVDAINKTFTIDDKTVKGDSVWARGGEIILMNSASSGGAMTNMRGKMFSAKIYEGDLLVRSYIPVMSYEGNPEMYDEVSGTFAERHGDFLYGELDGGGYKCVRRFSSRSTRRLRSFRAMRSRNLRKEVA